MGPTTNKTKERENVWMWLNLPHKIDKLLVTNCLIYDVGHNKTKVRKERM